MEKLSFRLEKFEGPLDALLYLISKNKMSIYDISISDLLDQYMEYLDTLTEMDLEVTSDFLEMASRLVQIKSAMLLPKPEESEDAGEKDRLISELIEYSACKVMAAGLRDSACFDYFTRAPMKIEPDKAYTRRHRPQEIADAYLSAVSRAKMRLPPMQTAFKGIVGTKIVSVGSRVVFILKALMKGGRRPFLSLFRGNRGRSEIVATFLAVLELIKSKTVYLEGDGGGESTIQIRKRKRG